MVTGRCNCYTPPDVFNKKYPLPDCCKGDVLAVVHQSTVPVLPKPVCVAPHAKVTAVPGPPNVSVLPDLFSILFTLTCTHNLSY